MKIRRRRLRGLERGTLTLSMYQAGERRWVEAWATTRGVVYIATDFESGVRTVYMHDDDSEDAQADLATVLNHE